MKLCPYLTPNTKVNSTWIKDQTIRPKPMKFLEENTGQRLHDGGFRNDFLDMTSMAQSKENQQIGFHENFRFLIMKISTS